MNMLRRLLISLMVLTLTVSAVACGGSPSSGDSYSNQSKVQSTSAQVQQNRLSNGQYPVQQATYNDADGEYTVMVLNTKPGDSSTYRTTNLPMARLTDQEIAQGQKSYLKVENNQPSLHLTEDFKIEYVHNVTENVTNPQTGQTETVVVRQNSGFWAPFAGAVAGQALGSLLFRPHYYFPPAYNPGGLMTGYGGYGRTYDVAVNNYRQRYNAPPAEVRNRQTFRTSGNLRTSTSNRVGSQSRDRSTGSGYGTNTLRRSNRSTGTYRSTPRSGFGSSSRARSFGSRRR